MKNLILLLLLFTSIALADFTYPSRRQHSGTVGWEKIPYQWDDNLETYLRCVASMSGPADSHPTLVIQQTWRSSLGGCPEVLISSFDGKLANRVIGPYGATPEEVMHTAVTEWFKGHNYWADKFHPLPKFKVDP